MVGFGQGGPTDIVARILADQLSGLLGTSVFVENRPGASGNIATQAVARAPADGHTLMIGALPFAVNHWLFPDFGVRFGTDIVALAPIGATPNLLVVPPSLGVRSVAAFRELALSRPDAVTYATLGRGSSSHLAGVVFDQKAGTALLPVAFTNNNEATQNLIGGHVMAWFAPLTSVLELVRSGRLVALGVTAPERVAALPEVPTLAESGLPGFDVRVWVGLFAAAGIPAERMAVLERALDQARAAAAVQAALDAQGIAPLGVAGRAGFHDFVVAEIGRWQPVVAALR
ncbi:tripartite tricarboxylate transporter substrate binding protein [Rhodoplanes sp. TEM]|uniref:Tripartite tricarboxylate transporter substrate binding protein n=1 Tax=Rhodoplanes tepidamans TaxID=200616 RepID=A0ABT5JLD7_RHOTP|nr:MULTISPECIES: tripartite tricarboxylate transporter substrate binding protein [Rhodoplanes]MDC7789710.1 tripartite tricarboxylate transporter substrate binding protein [Rhodoplanes tepidamans]MDC7985859.1 tripartite tricarboxylate transporter substrate binding protein [Rhodoplanes sp. TEM]MDQ0354387.1 tripartite-type tricarboxylate transporter receptor subunit TctC [Rhodoplanes tepidamans]